MKSSAIERLQVFRTATKAPNFIVWGFCFSHDAAEKKWTGDYFSALGLFTEYPNLSVLVSVQFLSYARLGVSV